jgi:hypothetical protein
MKQLTRAKFVFYFNPEQRFEQGAGSLAAGAREPEIAYASARIRPFSLASNPAGHPRKSNSPTRINSGRRRNKKSAINKRLHFASTNVYVKNNLFIYKNHTTSVLIHKQKRA